MKLYSLLFALIFPMCLNAQQKADAVAAIGLKGFGEMKFDTSFNYAVSETKQLGFVIPSNIQEGDKVSAKAAASKLTSEYKDSGKYGTLAAPVANYGTAVAYVILAGKRAELEHPQVRSKITSEALVAFVRRHEYVPIISEPSPAKVLVNTKQFPDTATALAVEAGEDTNYRVTVTYNNQSQTKNYNPKTSPEKELRFIFKP
jgi:hypothetical protein